MELDSPIVITGGHPAPALAVIDELRRKGYKNLHFIGRQFAQEGSAAESYEFKAIHKLKIPFYHLQTGKLVRVASMETIKDLSMIFKGLWQAFWLLWRIRPEAIMSFGGYIALPVCLVAKLMRIRVVTHEQTIAPGVANEIICRFADKILLSFPESMKYFDVSRTRITGNPIRRQAQMTLHKPFDFEMTKPILYVTGGSLGSHSINVHIEDILPELLKDFIVIHQVGNVEKYGDFERLSRLKKKNYYVRDHFSSDEVGWVFRNSDIVISRSGANTTFELIYYRKPSVLIPLPWSANGEQQKHAQLLEKAGAVEVFDQFQDSSVLLEKIEMIKQNYDSYKKGFRSLQEYLHEDAPALIVEELLD